MAATTETFTIDSVIVPFERRPGRAPSPEATPEPIGRIFFPINETTTLVGATDSVVMTFALTLPVDGVFRLKSLSFSLISATAATPAIATGRYSQSFVTTPDVDVSNTLFRLEIPMFSGGGKVAPSNALRFFSLGLPSTSAGGQNGTWPPYFKGAAGTPPRIILYDDDGGVEVLSVVGLAVYDYWTVSQYQYGLPLLTPSP